MRKTPKATEQQALAAVRTLISYIGDDPNREGLGDTPARVLKAWTQDWGRGYAQADTKILRTFRDDTLLGSNQMIVVRQISLFSHCEHHMTPFFGTAAIAYVPDPSTGIVGLSKLARVVDLFARRLQVQERLTEQIADCLQMQLSEDVGVLLDCKHFCMISRGVMQPNASTRTTALRGEFLNDPSTREEFLRACAG